ncbi:MAG: hypothetical protein QOJ09_1187 [Actinomycetota bacterium]|nr:hypothetical protein [Actinomycetota bacterium]
MKRLGLIAGIAAALVLTTGGVARAVSDGQYNYNKQHCSAYADNYTTSDSAEPGCHSAQASVSDGNGNEWFSYGYQQTPDGTSVDPFSPEVSGDPNAGDPTTGLHVYFGADDNLDNGEHDSSPLVDNGPSDGGGIQANLSPESVGLWVAALTTGDTPYLLTHPLPLVDGGFGACADGLCFAATSQERTAYQGTGTNDHPVYDYSGKTWDPQSCAGPSDTTADCSDGSGTHDITYWEAQDGRVTTEPGVQVYEDPDPQGSPIGPYPLTAAYAGTCGVTVGGGDVQAPASPATNDAGQVHADTGC